MAIRHIQSQDGRLGFEQTAERFREALQGRRARPDFLLMEQFLRTFGVEVVSPVKEYYPSTFKPRTEMEGLLPHLGLEPRIGQRFFTVRKDSYQTVVFEDGGRYSLPNVLYDEVSRKAQAVSLPDVGEELLKVASWGKRIASPCDELIGGAYGQELGGRATWDRALEFDVPGMLLFFGLRYKDFGSSLAVRAVFAGGHSFGLDSFPHLEQKALLEGLRGVFARELAINEYFHSVSKYAKPTREQVPVGLGFESWMQWSRGVDLSVSGMPEFKGLRYLEFPGYTNVYLVNNDGSARPAHEVPLMELEKVHQQLKIQFDSLVAESERKGDMADRYKADVSGLSDESLRYRESCVEVFRHGARLGERNENGYFLSFDIPGIPEADGLLFVRGAEAGAKMGVQLSFRDGSALPVRQLGSGTFKDVRSAYGDFVRKLRGGIHF